MLARRLDRLASWVRREAKLWSYHLTIILLHTSESTTAYRRALASTNNLDNILLCPFFFFRIAGFNADRFDNICVWMKPLAQSPMVVGVRLITLSGYQLVQESNKTTPHYTYHTNHSQYSTHNWLWLPLSNIINGTSFGVVKNKICIIRAYTSKLLNKLFSLGRVKCHWVKTVKS